MIDNGNVVVKITIYLLVFWLLHARTYTLIKYSVEKKYPPNNRKHFLKQYSKVFLVVIL